MRVKRIKVTGCAIPGLFIKGRTHECIEGLPEDAKFLRAWFDSSNDCFSLIFESESFEDIRVGEQIPELRTEFRRLTLPKQYFIYLCGKCGELVHPELEKCPKCGWMLYDTKEVILKEVKL
jgi:hypothetical protein